MVEKKKFNPREVLRQNVQALIESKVGPTTQGELKRKSGAAQATIGRILSARGENARIETIEKIAGAYGLQGWQLLIAGMDPKNPPVLAPVTKEERAFWARMRELYAELGKGPDTGPR
jgi:transcriptional regulator with XRE-family HTH domain